MKLLFVNHEIDVSGGLEKVLDTVTNKLEKKRIHFKFLVIDHKKFNNKKKWSKLYLRYSNDVIPWIDEIQVEEAVKKFSPDFVISTNFLDFHKIVGVDILRSKKLVYWDHGTLSAPFFYKLLPISKLEYTNLFLLVSKGIKEKISKIFPLTKSLVLYNPVEPYYGTLIKRSKKPLFVYIGRLEDNSKNISFLLKGFSYIRNKDWELKIIGTGPSEIKLKQLANHLKISNRIDWMGYKEEPFNFIKEATALLLTSKFEGLPIVLIEAIQRGLPVISSNCNFGPSDIVLEGHNGYLYEMGNIDKFIELLNLAIDKKLYLDAPEKIAKTVKKFNADNIVNNLLKIFQNLKKDFITSKVILTKYHKFFRDDSFIIFGAGSFGKIVKDMLINNNKKVAYFVDNDIQKQGKMIDNIEIKHPLEIKQFEHKIIIASMWENEIFEQLKSEYGLTYLQNYI